MALRASLATSVVASAVEVLRAVAQAFHTPEPPAVMPVLYSLPAVAEVPLYQLFAVA